MLVMIYRLSEDSVGCGIASASKAQESGLSLRPLAGQTLGQSQRSLPPAGRRRITVFVNHGCSVLLRLSESESDSWLSPLPAPVGRLRRP